MLSLDKLTSVSAVVIFLLCGLTTGQRAAPQTISEIGSELGVVEVQHPTPSCGTEDELEKSSQHMEGFIDTPSYQAQELQKGEVEGDELDMDMMDADNIQASEIPANKPSEAEINEMLVSKGAVEGSTKLAEYNPYVAYISSEFLTTWRCCPRRQGYGCRSYYTNMPCFRHYVNGRWVRCCTVWPRNIRYAHCNCHKCAVLTPYCASVGRCLRRYRSQRVWAVCFNSVSWSLEYVTRRVPSSCYCRATC